MKYYIDNIKKRDSEMVVSGWAVSDSLDVPVEIEIVGKKSGSIPFTRADAGRFDVNREFFLGKSPLKLGFCITFFFDPEENYEIVFRADGKVIREKLKVGGTKDRHSLLVGRLCRLLRPDTIQRGFAILKQYGWRTFLRKLFGNWKSREKRFLP